MRYRTLPLNTPAMVIDPDKQQSGASLSALNSAGYSPCLVECGRDALVKLPVFQPRLVILNPSLPDISSQEVVEYIHNELGIQKIWIFVITDEPYSCIEFLSLVDLVLLKPVQVAQLRDLAIRFRRCVI